MWVQKARAHPAVRTEPPRGQLCSGCEVCKNLFCTHTHTGMPQGPVQAGAWAGGCSVLHCSGGLLSASAESEQSFNKGGGKKKKTKQEEELSFSLVPLQKP